MELSKHVPARTKTVKFNWCQKDWLPMSQQYRNIRSRLRNPMDKCFWCGHEFEDGELMSLAQPEKGTNKVLCHLCATNLLQNA